MWKRPAAGARRGSGPLRLAQLEQHGTIVGSAERRVAIIALAKGEAGDAPVPVDAAVEIGNPEGDARDVHATKLTG